MLPRDERLRAPVFDRTFRGAVLLKHPLIHLRAARATEAVSAAPRAAFVVPKKQGKAVLRNRLRRQVRECYRLHEMRASESLRGWNLIFLTTPATAAADAAAVSAAIESVLGRLLARAGGRPAPPLIAYVQPRAPADSGCAEGGPGDNGLGGHGPGISAACHEAVCPAGGGETASSTGVTEARETLAQGWSPLSPAGLALTLISLYQRFVSPGMPPSCRFYPTCSRYTYEAIELHGLWRGGFLGLCRVCRCHPWNAGGFDPVPGSAGLRRDSPCARQNK